MIKNQLQTSSSPLPLEMEKYFKIHQLMERFGFTGFPNPPENQPYMTSNFVQTLDGVVSFLELAGRTGGKEISRSTLDAMYFSFLQMWHDASFFGANTLRNEAGSDGAGWDLHLSDEFHEYRLNVLKLGLPKVMVFTGSGNLDLNFTLFNSEKVEPWIITTAEGSRALEPQFASRSASAKPVKIIVAGESGRIDFPLMLDILRKQHGIRTLQCLGGPTLHGELIKLGLVNELFLTISAQIVGKSTNAAVLRPTIAGKEGWSPETAPWLELNPRVVYEPPYHIFVRGTYEGPRKFED